MLKERFHDYLRHPSVLHSVAVMNTTTKIKKRKKKRQLDKERIYLPYTFRTQFIMGESQGSSSEN